MCDTPIPANVICSVLVNYVLCTPTCHTPARNRYPSLATVRETVIRQRVDHCEFATTLDDTSAYNNEMVLRRLIVRISSDLF
jgi:hypothetical protein